MMLLFLNLINILFSIIFKLHIPDVYSLNFSRYTSSKSDPTTVYAIFLQWPETLHLKLASPVASLDTEITMLGFSSDFEYYYSPGFGLDILIPDFSFNQLPCKWGWILKMTNIQN